MNEYTYKIELAMIEVSYCNTHLIKASELNYEQTYVVPNYQYEFNDTIFFTI